MLLFSAVVAPGGALLEFQHNGFVDVTDHELRHSRTTSRMLAMLASRDQVGNRALTAVVTIGPIDGGFAPWGLPNAGYAAPPSRHHSADCPSTRQWLLRSQVPHATLFLVEGSNGDSNGERRWHVPEAFAGLYAAK